MCGIAGIVSFVDDVRSQEKNCRKMMSALARRGPDQNDIAVFPEAVLAHTRLAVIDIQGGRQPMSCHCSGEYVIVYNGELYNTDEIRRELEKDYEFTTRSDTEVVLKSYVKWGCECVQRFNGIFAFAVLDRLRGTLFLARDRIGVKPLFYYENGSTLCFASEIPALIANTDIPRKIDAQGVSELLLISPGRTPGNGVLKGIKEVRPGWCGFFTQEGLALHEYWRLRAYELHETFEDTAQHVRELVEDAVRRQLVSDVPVCTFLSGGLDSSLISSIAASEMKKQGKRLATFSVDYKDNGKYFQSSHFQPDSDEEYIREMVQYLDTDHHLTVVEVPELVQALYESTQARGLPGMSDVDASLLVFCREIKKYGTVALSGECADEIFGGYPWYRDKDIRMTDGFPWAQSTEYRSTFLAERYSTIDAQEYVYSRYSETVEYTDKLHGESALEGRMREMTQLNFHWFMQTLLDRKDRMSMYSGLEVRVPFCDYRIAEYLYNVKWEYKEWQGREKGLLRKAMEGWLPEKVLWRKKSPYPKTHDPAFLNAVTNELSGILSAGTPLTEIVNIEALKKLLDGKDHIQWYGQLMNLPQTIAFFIQLHHWLTFFDIDIE